MSEQRIIRPVRDASLARGGAAELNLEDVRELGRQMVREARRRVEELHAEARALQAATAVRRHALEEELEAERRRCRETLSREREEALEAGRQEGLELGRRAGYQEGYEKGRQDGYREGHEAETARVSAEAERMTRALKAVATELEVRRDELLAGARAELLDLALEIARRVTKREARTHHREIVLESLRQAIDLIFARSRVVVQVHQEDMAAAQKYAHEALDGLGGAAEIDVRPVSDVEPGGCRVLCGTGVVDLTLDVQLDMIERALLSEHIDSDGNGSASGGAGGEVVEEVCG